MFTRRQLWRKQGYKKIDNLVIQKKKVSFNILVSVVLIPSRSDYITEKLIDILWYQQSDYMQFFNNCNCTNVNYKVLND